MLKLESCKGKKVCEYEYEYVSVTLTSCKGKIMCEYEYECVCVCDINKLQG